MPKLQPINFRLASLATLVTWQRLVLAGIFILPPYLFPRWDYRPYNPRQAIYDHDLRGLLLSLWAPPAWFYPTLSRYLQLAFVLRLPGSTPLTYSALIYPIWVAIGLSRVPVANYFSEWVGQRENRYFRHWALYEDTIGFGPALAVLLVCHAAGVISSEDPTGANGQSTSILEGNFGIPLALASAIAMCWLEDASWTYWICIPIAMVVVVAHRTLRGFLHVGRNINSRYQRVPVSDIGVIGTATYKASGITVLGRLVAFVVVAGISFGIMLLPYSVNRARFNIPMTPMPISPFAHKPLLEVLVLSYPRSNIKKHTSIMKTTIDSYLPLLQEGALLSVYTQAKKHKAMEDVKPFYTSYNNITFHTNTKEYPGHRDGHYLHLAEALGWAAEKRPGHEPTEWVLLIEDDFPLCGGEEGRNGLREVLRVLESSRWPSHTDVPRRRGGWIGTGGSGIIMHNSWLQILQMIIKTHASEEVIAMQPVGYVRPPDIILQNCVMGEDPFCRFPWGTRDENCPDRFGKSSNCGMVMTSRQIMDHIGALMTTHPQTAGSSPHEWRCGFRHPKHGMTGFEVVPVDW
ncbi:hypothetical protein FA15DRAFT_674411 [Coprinopsis marcescibilis]|uniref:Uncharacterized protein n=1 Tax=Coprinopsis marcescibilis TaxID=230819 RepID=A0A5C3KHX7_COPMA|nr:hypothetical protein FA15DRAFT_674411 [Coprinopsis marcescibilis]